MEMNLDLLLSEVKKEYSDYLDSFATEIESIVIETKENKNIELTDNGDKVVYKKRMNKQYLGGFYVNQKFAQRLKEARRWGSSEYEMSKGNETYIEYCNNRFDFISLGKYKFSITRDYATSIMDRYL